MCGGFDLYSSYWLEGSGSIIGFLQTRRGMPNSRLLLDHLESPFLVMYDLCRSCFFGNTLQKLERPTVRATIRGRLMQDLELKWPITYLNRRCYAALCPRKASCDPQFPQSGVRSAGEAKCHILRSAIFAHAYTIVCIRSIFSLFTLPTFHGADAVIIELG